MEPHVNRFLWILSVLVTIQQCASTDVCIIGAGIGGSATAKFLHDLDASIHMTVFERNAEAGGRTKAIKFKSMDNDIDAGASILHIKNKYLIQFAEEFGLEIIQKPDEKWGIFDGTRFVFESSRSSVINFVKLWWRYGYSLVRMERFVHEGVDDLIDIYRLQEAGEAFRNPIDMFRRLGLYHLTQVTLSGVMVEHGIPHRLINEMMAAINRVNYGQNCTLNALAGMAGIAGAGSGIRVVKGGFQQISRSLLKASKATVRFQTTVEEIMKAEDGGYVVKDDKENTTRCDAVVIAAPLEQSALKLPPTASEIQRREYQLTQTTFVKGRLNAVFFGKTSKFEDLAAVYTTESSLNFFNSIGRLTPFIENRAIYKVFSRRPLTEEQLKMLFKEPEVLLTIPWKAYPHFTPPEKFSPFELEKGLIYINTIESAASAMEISAMGAKNAALLVHEFLYPAISKQAEAGIKTEL